MGYALGVDLGTTYSAAAVARGADAHAVPVGGTGAAMPSVVAFLADGRVLVGDAAEAHASAEPGRVAREFKRRLGDPVPILVSGVPHTPEELMAHLLREVLGTVTAREGAPPDVVVLTHPANHGDHQTALLRQVAASAGLPAERVVLLTEPEAAAVAHSRRERIEVGQTVAIYDFGGGTFDTALVRRTAGRFELVGVPEGMDRLGGIDIDQAVLARVDQQLGGALSSADRRDPTVLSALQAVRVACRTAKEQLSVQDAAIVPVRVAGVQADVTLTRGELEAMVRPRLVDSVRALERTVASAALRPDAVTRVLLVGGSSRIPLVGSLVHEHFGRPVVLDDDPKLSIAVGAALMGAATAAAPSDVSPAAAPLPPPVLAPPAVAPPVPAAVPPSGEEWQAPARSSTPRPVSPTAAPTARSRRPRRLLVAGALGVAAAAVAGAVILGGGDGPATSSPATTLAPAGTSSGSTAAGSAGSVPAPAPGGTVDLFAFGGSAGSGIPGPARTAGVPGVVAVTTDSAGAVLVLASDGAVLRIDGGEVSSLGGLPTAAGAPGGLVVRPDRSVVVSSGAGLGTVGEPAAVVLDGAAAGLGRTAGPVAVDGVGNLYVADNEHHRVIRVGSDGSLGLVLGDGSAARPGVPVPEGAPAAATPVGFVVGLAVDLQGNLLVADRTTGLVLAVGHDGDVRTLIGGGDRAPAEGVPLPDVALGRLAGLAVERAGSILLSDADAGVVLRAGGDGSLRVVIGGAGRPARDGVPASESGVGALGAVAAGRDGAVYFVDGTSIRVVQP